MMAYRFNRFNQMNATVPSVSTDLCGIQLKGCLYNASGALCTEDYELLNLYQSESAAVLTKSCTLRARKGNPEPRYHGRDGFSINSMGIPNWGCDYYLNVANAIVATAIVAETFTSKPSKPSKPYFLSVSGLSPEENLDILKIVKGNPNIDAVELNVSCPNIQGKSQLGYDFKALDEFLSLVGQVWNVSVSDDDSVSVSDDVASDSCSTRSTCPMGLKLPPYFDMAHFEEVAQIILKFKFIRFITCSNSLGNGLCIDTESESVVIKPKNGFGGIGGAPMKYTTLANVHKFYTLLNRERGNANDASCANDASRGDDAGVDIIACGGITSGEDMFQLILAGAKACQVGTQLVERGLSVFTDYQNQLVQIMERKGYTQLSDFRGKLKYIE